MIHFIFPSPDEFGQIDYLAGQMTAYVNRSGWSETREYALINIDQDYLPALQSAIASIVSLGEDWQAVQAWADNDTETRMIDDEQIETIDVVNLRVEGRHIESNAVRGFTAADYPVLSLSDPAMVAFYEHFTNDENLHRRGV